MTETTALKTTVLILTANPTNTKPLRLSEEVREIKAAWERSSRREKFEIIVEEAVHSKDLRRSLLDNKIASTNLSLDELFSLAPTEEGPFSDHLYRHFLVLEENPRLKTAMRYLIKSDRPLKLDAKDSFKLKSMGLAKAAGNELLPLCQLYRLYFSDRLED